MVLAEVRRRVVTLMHNAAILVIGFQMCVIYGAAALWKAQGPVWENGTALYYILHIDWFRAWPALSDSAADHPTIIAVIAYVTVFAQIGFPFAVFSKRLKYALLVLLLGMHLSIAVLLGIPVFSAVMIIGDSVFLPDTFWLALGTLAHTVGWPVARGGSQAIADALAKELRERGGTIVTGHRVRSLAELPRARAILLDVSPAGLLALASADLPPGYVRALRAAPSGVAVCKVDFALSGPVPWAAPDCARAGTLHLVGTREEAIAAERAVAAGRHAERPYVLAVQPGVVDPTRAPQGRDTLYAYAHVPFGSELDLGEVVTAQVERFAPGFRDLVLARHVVPARALEEHNPNCVGGGFTGGGLSLWHTAMRPVPRRDPYVTPIEGVYLCSASTPPGPAVHGMCGVHAAARALRQCFGIRTDPLRFVSNPV